MAEAVKGNEYEAFLTSVGDLMEAEILMSLLKSEGIPVRKKHNLTGDYLEVMGNITPFGIDLFVPPQELQRAKEIINAQVEISDEEVFANANEELDNRPSSTQNKWNQRKKIAKIILVIAILAPLVIIYLMRLLDF